MGVKVTIPTKDHSAVYFHRADGSSLWTVTFRRGLPPRQLRGSFTSYEDAVWKVNSYLKTRYRFRTELLLDQEVISVV